VISAEQVWTALEDVRDPELDRSVVDLDFIQSVSVDGADARVALRLPTYWCSPSFAYMMVSDAHAAVSSLEGVGTVRIELVDHHAGETVTDGVHAGRSFTETFPDHADGELGELRRKFRLKAFLVRQEPVLRAARDAFGADGAVALRLEDGAPPLGVDPGEWREYLCRRREVDMDDDPDALVFTSAQGEPLDAAELDHYIRVSRSVRVSLMANTEFCKGLLAARYDGLEHWQQAEVTR
jgi:metal-sulfur cluster biosynthetic enzyme